MAYLEPKLVTKLSQKQVLTPGLVQMVSLLTLNKLELTEMIQQELVQNPVLEEGTEIVESTEPEMDLNQDGPEGASDAATADVDTTDAEYERLGIFGICKDRRQPWPRAGRHGELAGHARVGQGVAFMFPRRQIG